MHKVTPRLLGKEGRNRKQDEICKCLMTLSSTLVGQTGTIEPGAGWKEGSAHYSTPQQRIFREMSPAGVHSTCSLCLSQVTDLLHHFLLEQEGILTEVGWFGFSTAYLQHSSQIKGQKGAVLTSSRLKLRINTQPLAFSQSPSNPNAKGKC